MLRKALKDFHYARDGVNAVLQHAGRPVDVLETHVAKLEAEGCIEPAAEDPTPEAQPGQMAGLQPTRQRRRK